MKNLPASVPMRWVDVHSAVMGLLCTLALIGGGCLMPSGWGVGLLVFGCGVMGASFWFVVWKFAQAAMILDRKLDKLLNESEPEA